MHINNLWFGGVTALGCLVSIVGCHELSNGDISPTVTQKQFEDGFSSETYSLALIQISYKNEHGEMYEEASESGKYGEGYVGFAEGVAVLVQAAYADGGEHDHTGCTWPLLNAADPAEPLPSEPWIAVMRRGSCNFEIKVQNAWKSNASAALIYNDRDTTVLEKMKLSNSYNRNMSAVFTYMWKGEEITRLIDNGTRVMLSISKSATFTSINKFNKTSVLFVSISFIVLMVISLAWLVFYYIQRFRSLHAKDRLSKRLCSAAKKALSKIPTKNLKTGDREIQGDGDCCAICIETYKVSDTLRSLPCRHDFHKNCIDPWLLEHRNCPICKMDILKYYGFVFTGSQESMLQMEVDEVRTRPPRNPAPRPRPPIPLLSNDHTYAEAISERSSRASSPDQLVPPTVATEINQTASRSPSPGDACDQDAAPEAGPSS